LEPGLKELYNELLPLFCFTKMQEILNAAFAAEQAARMFSMRTATKNAGEMIEDLTLLRNKLRQTGITREMIELVSGSVASQ
jgi:F-type H+-transporting ATPase subunit gamma